LLSFKVTTGDIGHEQASSATIDPKDVLLSNLGKLMNLHTGKRLWLPYGRLHSPEMLCKHKLKGANYGTGALIMSKAALENACTRAREEMESLEHQLGIVTRRNLEFADAL
jgi:hypothetical protein